MSVSCPLSFSPCLVRRLARTHCLHCAVLPTALSHEEVLEATSPRVPSFCLRCPEPRIAFPLEQLRTWALDLGRSGFDTQFCEVSDKLLYFSETCL